MPFLLWFLSGFSGKNLCEVKVGEESEDGITKAVVVLCGLLCDGSGGRPSWWKIAVYPRIVYILIFIYTFNDQLAVKEK